MEIKILDEELYITFLVDNRVLAYSVHYNKEKSLKHLEKIKNFHELEGKVVDNFELTKEYEKIISNFLEGKYNFNINLKIYKNYKVYEELLKVPIGKTITYSELAKRTNLKIFEVIRTLAHNPFLILIPCHRVIRKDGKISGYTPLGKSFKIKLLRKEGFIQIFLIP